MSGRVGIMVRAGGGQPMKVLGIADDGVARCILVDSDGRIRRRFHHVDQLSPLWLSLQPKSMWPEITQIDQIENEKEERAAAVVKKQKQQLAKKIRKQRSRKIRRRKVAA